MRKSRNKHAPRGFGRIRYESCPRQNELPRKVLQVNTPYSVIISSVFTPLYILPILLHE